MRKSLVSILITGLLVAIMALACSSESADTQALYTESAETQALYTDAKQMFTDINGAFQLPPGQARVDTMRRIIGDKWDEQIVQKLNQYVQDAPGGKYAAEAKQLLEEVGSSQYIRMIGQARPLLEQAGMPKSPEEADSLAKQLESEKSDSQ